MAAACVSSPFCTWFLAACMFMGREKDLGQKSCMFQSPKGQNRRRKLASKCTSNGGPASLYGTGIQNFMSSCLSCKPCEEYSGSNWFPSSLSFFDDDASSICGSKPSPLNRRRRRKNGSASISVTDNTGNAIPQQPKREDTMQKKLQAVELPEREETIKKISQDEKRRVVVTGLGVLTSIGQDADTFYSNLLDGTSGISEIEAFDCSRFPTKIAGEIKSFSAEGWVLPKLCKRMDKFMLYLLTAGKKALADGGITELVNKELDKARCGVIIGSSLGGLKVFTDAIEALRVSYRKMNPFCIPFATTNMGSALLAIDLGWMGPNYSISSACATSNFCILNAANSIMRGETEVMLCGGTDAAIVPIGLAGFVACRTLSNRNGDPTKASRPWDTERDGFVLGEGAGVLLLEELQHAKRRGAKIYAEFLGGSFTCDAYHMTEPHPDGKGIALCMEQALANSGVAREDVNYINAHATSTQTGDLSEYQALVRCFGKNPEIRINSTKSMIGHLLGASGAVEAVATVKAIQTGWIHPNINLENPDKAVDMNLLVDAEKERLDIKVFPLPRIPTSLDNSATNSCNPKQRRETPSTMHEPWAIGSPDLRFGPKEEKDNS